MRTTAILGRRVFISTAATERARGTARLAAIAAWILALFLLAAVPVTELRAQDVPPPPAPERDTQSGTGVSLVSGAYSYSWSDLKIGTGSFPQALSVDITYSSAQTTPMGRYDGLSGWGWATPLVAYIDVKQGPPLEGFPNIKRVRYSVVSGTGTVGSFYDGDGGFSGPFQKFSLKQGQTLAVDGDELVFTDRDGTKSYFFKNNPSTLRKRLEAKDGTVLTFNYDSGFTLQNVISNRGVAIVFEDGADGWSKACAVNLTEHYVDATTATCPAGVPYVTFAHENVSSTPNLLSITDATGGITQFGYTSTDRVNCVKLPGQSACQVTNTYSTCVHRPDVQYDPSDMNAGQQVRSQIFATGETVSYSFPSSGYCPRDPSPTTVTMTFADSSTKLVQTDISNLPTLIRDANGHETTFENDFYDISGAKTLMVAAEYPEGNRTEIGYDSNGNQSGIGQHSKDGTDELDWGIGHGACNQVTGVTDPLGHVTSYTYDSTHCGITKKTGPADANGVQPQTRYAYAQRYAWIKNSSGGYQQAASPVWVLTSEEYCRTSAADSSGNCTAGASDEVVTTYDYGPDSGPNNLWLRGKAVTADGVTLRTCYTLDSYGRTISETAPNANLASCS